MESVDNVAGRRVVELTRSESWSLLLDMVVGRLAVVVGGRPEIFPVNYLVHGEEIVFRSGEGTKLGAALGHPVALEVDDYDPRLTGDAWSVVIKGTARELDTTADTDLLARLPQFQWHAGPGSRAVRIVPDEVSGRRYELAR